MQDLDIKIQTAIISGIVTISVMFLKGLAKPLWEKHFHNFKLNSDHEHEQRKQIKEKISEHKVPLIDAAEYLNHRLWNFTDNIGEGWHNLNDDEDLKEKYYVQSFSYRFLAFFAWARKVEKDMIYLDSTISESEDLEFIKFIKLLPQIFWDAAIFDGHTYNNSEDKDHFYRDDFNKLLESLIVDQKVISYTEFTEREKNREEYKKVYSYLSKISNDKTCLKWQAMQSFHFLLMAFLTKFGYDFQKTSEKSLYKLAKKSPKNNLLDNVKRAVNKIHLNKSKEINTSIQQLERI